MSDKGVFLTALWQNLVILNYEVDPALLRPFVPSGTELDQWNGKTFISLVGFQFLKTRMFGVVPIPFHSNFEEVNLRFYVKRNVSGEIRRGVVFIREFVPRWAIAYVARTFYNENYVALPMDHAIRSLSNNGLNIAYRWNSGGEWSEMNVETKGHAELLVEGSLEQFITEHYWGYAAQPDGGCVEYRVEHPSWKVWQVANANFEGNVEKFYGNEFAVVLRNKPDSAFLAEGSAVSVMRGKKL